MVINLETAKALGLEMLVTLPAYGAAVREALRSLVVHSGLLEARVGDGTYVRSFIELKSRVVRRAAQLL